MGGLLVLTLGCRNPNLKIAGFISSSALLGDPTDRKIDQFKKDGVNLLGEPLGVYTIYMFSKIFILFEKIFFRTFF